MVKARAIASTINDEDDLDLVERVGVALHCLLLSLVDPIVVGPRQIGI